jgi:hypothetical protein
MHKWRLLQKLYESMSFSIPSAVLIKALSAPMKGRIRALSSNEKPERFLPEISNWLKSPGEMPYKKTLLQQTRLIDFRLISQ